MNYQQNRLHNGAETLTNPKHSNNFGMKDQAKQTKKRTPVQQGRILGSELGMFTYDAQGMTDADFEAFMSTGFQINTDDMDGFDEDIENFMGVQSPGAVENVSQVPSEPALHESPKDWLSALMSPSNPIPFNASDLETESVPALFNDDITGGVQPLDFASFGTPQKTNGVEIMRSPRVFFRSPSPSPPPSPLRYKSVSSPTSALRTTDAAGKNRAARKERKVRFWMQKNRA